MNAFSGREKIGKGSHEDFGKIAIEMIKKLDKELPTLRSASFWLIALLLRVRCGLNAHAPMLRQLRATSRKHSHYVSHCSHRIGSTPTGPAEHWSDQQVIFTAAAAATVVDMMMTSTIIIAITAATAAATLPAPYSLDRCCSLLISSLQVHPKLPVQLEAQP